MRYASSCTPFGYNYRVRWLCCASVWAPFFIIFVSFFLQLYDRMLLQRVSTCAIVPLLCGTGSSGAMFWKKLFKSTHKHTQTDTEWPYNAHTMPDLNATL